MKKFLIILVILLAIGAVFFFRKDKNTNLIKYDYVHVSRGKIEVEVSASGTIQPVNVVSVGTQVSGTIEKVFVDYNSKVKKGDLIAQLETFNLDQELKEAEATLNDVKAKLKQAVKDAQRYRSLYEKHYVAKIKVEEAELAVVTAKTNYDRALAQVNIAKKNRSYADILSPVSGTVITKDVEEGQTVASSFNTPELFTIAEDLTKMQIEADISEADIGQIKAGLPVSFTVDTFPADNFFGVVSQVRLQPKEDSNVVMYTVIINIDNSSLKLLPGMTAYVTIKVEEKENILRLPNTAFQYRPIVAGQRAKLTNADRERIKRERQDLKQNEAFVYCEVDNKPVKVKVTKGIQNLSFTEILDGLNEGEQIITEDLTTKVIFTHRGP